MGSTTSCLPYSSGGERLLTFAAIGNIEEFSKMLQARPELVSYCGIWSCNSCLHYAAAAGNLTLLQTAAAAMRSRPDAFGTATTQRCVFGSSSSIVDQPNCQGQTPLKLACMSGCPRCVRFLLDMGADMFQRGGTEHWNAMHHAAASGKIQALNILLDSTAIMQNIGGPRAAVHEFLHCHHGSHSRHIDSPSSNGMTPLHLAMMAGSQSCAQALLRAGASMYVRSSAPIMSNAGILPAGSTPLHIAAQHGDTANIHRLLQAQQAFVEMRERSQIIRRLTGSRYTIDARAIANCCNQLPYHTVPSYCAPEILRALNPEVPSAQAFGIADELIQGDARRQQLLKWLEDLEHPGEHKANACGGTAVFWEPHPEQPPALTSQGDGISDGPCVDTYGRASDPGLYEDGAAATIGNGIQHSQCAASRAQLLSCGVHVTDHGGPAVYSDPLAKCQDTCSICFAAANQIIAAFNVL
ncbi:hypothetical protein WJX74_005006 [Apatococcus lobatus]|uniref:Uncharacterized protein n=1 Tax=Apatococcus lobatus TaxID=904363 RepID=A0AAW1RKZ2_9CHLO